MEFELSAILIWSAVILFAGGTISYSRGYSASRIAVALGWILFGLFWASMIEHFLFTKNSFIEGTLAAIALPLGMYAGYLTYTQEPPALFTFARAATAMSLIYLPVEQFPTVRRALIESVTVQTVWIVTAIFGHDLRIQPGPIYGYQSGIAAPNAPGGLLLTHIELACTGLGSIAIAVGVITVLKEPLRKRIAGAVVATVTIYTLNIVRTVFITAAYIGQWFQVYTTEVLAFTGYTDPRVTSFFIADKVISQSLSIIFLSCLFYLMVHLFPSFHTLVQETLDLFTQPQETAKE